MKLVTCENGGTLVADYNSIGCSCAPGYVGRYCEIGNIYLARNIDQGKCYKK